MRDVMESGQPGRADELASSRIMSTHGTTRASR